ncbi:SapB/AmfS family lanthipeptide [Streptomyces niveus]
MNLLDLQSMETPKEEATGDVPTRTRARQRPSGDTTQSNPT